LINENQRTQRNEKMTLSKQVRKIKIEFKEGTYTHKEIWALFDLIERYEKINVSALFDQEQNCHLITFESIGDAAPM